MQSNITEITQRLLRSLDNNYNVVDMPAVVEIITILEKVAITKELLETTRLGKYVNELRRKTSNESLSKRAKELLKKWKTMLLPESNGQMKQIHLHHQPQQQQHSASLERAKKRPTKDPPDGVSPIPATKRPKINGQSTEFEFSDNSNSSFKEALLPPTINNKISAQETTAVTRSNVILINSDSNSSLPDVPPPPAVEQQMPKKRGRKKGSKNHKRLIDEAESSFTNKLAVSRTNSKVKTTQELIAGLQNKSNMILGLSPSAAAVSTIQAGQRAKEDLNERAAKLTERVSIIDQTLYTNSNRSKQKNRYSRVNATEKNDKVIESGSVINDKSLGGALDTAQEDEEEDDDDDDEIIVVDDVDKVDELTEQEPEPPKEYCQRQLTLDELLAKLPPIDWSKVSETNEDEPTCTCHLVENKSDFSVDIDEEVLEGGGDKQQQDKYEYTEDPECPARKFYATKYKLGEGDNLGERVKELSEKRVPNVNGNITLSSNEEKVETDERGLFANVVPDVYSECKLRGSALPDENFKKYSVSEADDDRTGFAEWHECVEARSYDDDVLRILPYVVID